MAGDQASKKRASPRNDALASSIGSVLSVDGARKRPKLVPSTTSASSIPRCFDAGESPTASFTAAPPSPSPCAASNVRVVARLRPLSSKERSENSIESITASATSVGGDLTRVRVEGGKNFDYDAVLAPGAAQSQVYERSVGGMVRENLFKGFNVTIIAYGQTGSGKTYTMGTASDADKSVGAEAEDTELHVPSEADGIIPRAVYDLFSTRNNIPNATERVQVEMSYLEIYNEVARDLLCDHANNLTIRDSKTEGVTVQGLTWEAVSSPKQVSDLMESAAHRRATASTHMNAVSSRSHAICTVRITVGAAGKYKKAGDEVLAVGTEGEPTPDMERAQSDDVQEIRAKLTLVDLAGSERIKRTGAEGNRMKEGININKGLFVLGQVVSGLSEMGQGHSSAHAHIPYRDSKLTRLLQDSLGGNSRTIMVACVSPADSNIEESINTLRYAQRARNIKNSAVRNVVEASLSPEEAMLLRQENQRLQQRVQELEAALASGILPGTRKPVGEDLIDGVDSGQLDLVTALRGKCTAYQSTIERLQIKYDAAVEDALSASLNADRAQLNVERLQALVKQTSDIDDEQSNNDLTLVTQLRSELSDLKKQLHEARTDAHVARSLAASVVASGGNLVAVEEAAQAHGLSDEEDSHSGDEESENECLSSELVAVSGRIEQKEELAKRAHKEHECMEAMRSHFEKILVTLGDEVEKLTTEKARLFEKISLQGVRPGKKSSEETSQRIDELEIRIRELKAKVSEHKRTLRLREKAEKKCAQLAAEIAKDKARRAALQRKLKEESVERRQEKKAAKIEATRLLRNSQKLKFELEKVKRSAERQAVVLRRKAEQAANLQKKLAHRQKKRQTTSVDEQQVDVESSQALKGWIDSEIEHGILVRKHQEELIEQKDLLEDALDKQRESQAVSDDDSVVQVLASEIESRKEIIAELEAKMEDEKSSSMHDMLSFDAFSHDEIKAAFMIVLEQLVAAKGEIQSTHADMSSKIESAVSAAVMKERAGGENAAMKLKIGHSASMLALMETTSAAVENNRKSGDEDMLKLYLTQCSKVKETVSADLRDMKQKRDEMQETMNLFAHGMNLMKASKSTKKSNNRRVSFADPSFAEEEDAVPDVFEEDSDDSDWSPDTPGYKIRAPSPTYHDNSEAPPKSLFTELILPDTIQENAVSDCDDNIINVVKSEPKSEETVPAPTKVKEADYSKMKVKELKELLRSLGLPLSGKKSQLVARLIEHDQLSDTTDEHVVPMEATAPPSSTLPLELDKENLGKAVPTRTSRPIRRAALAESSAGNQQKRAPLSETKNGSSKPLTVQISHRDFMNDTMTSAAKRTRRLSPPTSENDVTVLTASAKKRKRTKVLQAINNAEEQLIKATGGSGPPIQTASATKKRKRNNILQAISNAEQQFSKLSGSI